MQIITSRFYNNNLHEHCQLLLIAKYQFPRWVFNFINLVTQKLSWHFINKIYVTDKAVNYFIRLGYKKCWILVVYDNKI